MAFQDLTGDSGFTSDSEGASANLDITMSDDSARNLWDVQAAIQQIATDFQTAVRAASDFNSYLISIRETSQTVQAPSLGMEGGEGGNMSYAGGRVDAPNLGGALQSEASQASRISEMEENSSGVGGGALSASRANARPVDVGGFINQGSQTAWLLQTLGGGRHEQGQELSAGERNAQFGARAIQGGLPAAQQFLRGGGLGGGAAMLGRLGAYGAVAYGAYQLVDAGLETYAQSRTMAIASNNSQNGVEWGFSQRLGQAGMALSPFVSQEDAAQIYNAATDQGWASGPGGRLRQGTFGQAVDFMYGAAKDYNMSPAQSAQLLQKSSVGAGESIVALSEQLLSLKKNLDGTGISMATATQNFTDLNSLFISKGASAPASSLFAGGIVKAFSSNTYLSTEGATTTQGLFGSQQMQNVLGGLTGSHPGAVYATGHIDATGKAFDNLISDLAHQALSMSGVDDATKYAQFAQMLSGLSGQPIDEQYARNLLLEYGAKSDLLSQGMKDQMKASEIGPLEHQNAAQAWFHGLDDWRGAAHAVSGHHASLAEDEKNSANINAYQNYNPKINALLSNSDLGNTVLYGPDGKPVTMDGNRVAGANIAKWFNDTANYAKFTDPKGGYYIQEGTGTKYNASNLGTGGDISSGNLTTGGATGDNTVLITLSPQAKAWFDTNKDKLQLSTGHS